MSNTFWFQVFFERVKLYYLGQDFRWKLIVCLKNCVKLGLNNNSHMTVQWSSGNTQHDAV